MNTKQAELVSALSDGELDAATLDTVVSSMAEEHSEGRERLARYRLIGDTLRGETAMDASGIAAGVRDALRDEPVVLAPARARPPRWLKPATGVALAASVAAAAIVIAPGMMSSHENGASTVVVAQTPALPIAPALVGAGSAAGTSAARDETGEAAKERWQAIDPELQSRLNRLVIEHHEFSGRTGINGPVSHIGLVNYEGR